MSFIVFSCCKITTIYEDSKMLFPNPEGTFPTASGEMRIMNYPGSAMHFEV